MRHLFYLVFLTSIAIVFTCSCQRGPVKIRISHTPWKIVTLDSSTINTQNYYWLHANKENKFDFLDNSILFYYDSFGNRTEDYWAISYMNSSSDGEIVVISSNNEYRHIFRLEDSRLIFDDGLCIMEPYQ